MPYEAKILLDSVTPDGHRLTTFVISYPRFVHAELMTHRVLSRNAASSRAIPVTKMMERVKNDTAMLVWYGKNQPGMQAKEELDEESKQEIIAEWLDARDYAIVKASKMTDKKLHKQGTNRIIEPYMFITVIVSATQWGNFFKLRCHPNAQPEFQKIAVMMKELYDKSIPQRLDYGEWNIPMLQPDEDKLDTELKLKVATGRCARISYLTHEGKRDLEADAKLHDTLQTDGHWSPFEHCAQACKSGEYKFSNFRGWNQYRKFFPGEDGECM